LIQKDNEAKITAKDSIYNNEEKRISKHISAKTVEADATNKQS